MFGWVGLTNFWLAEKNNIRKLIPFITKVFSLFVSISKCLKLCCVRLDNCRPDANVRHLRANMYQFAVAPPLGQT